MQFLKIKVHRFVVCIEVNLLLEVFISVSSVCVSACVSVSLSVKFTICSPGSLQTSYEDQTGLEFGGILLPQPREL